MIRTFRSKPLVHRRILLRLDRLDAAQRPEDMNLPGFNFHPLRGFRPTRYSVHVNGPWCLTFEFEDGDAVRVDFEQYH
jgi:proteic killer suppression protein